MAKKELKSWDRRPWPKEGDKDINQTYIAMAKALTTWEQLEGFLSGLFSKFVVGSVETSTPAKRAYCAIRTFEARAEMLKAASEAYFENNPNSELQNHFIDLFKRTKDLSARRNEIAHSVIFPFHAETYPDDEPYPHRTTKADSFALYPTYASFNHRDLADKPSYCYTSKEIYYFIELFAELCGKIGLIFGSFDKIK